MRSSTPATTSHVGHSTGHVTLTMPSTFGPSGNDTPAATAYMPGSSPGAARLTILATVCMLVSTTTTERNKMNITDMPVIVDYIFAAAVIGGLITAIVVGIIACK